MEKSVIINKTMTEKEQYEAIAKEIHSDTSPVGIDAKKTHILILQKLTSIEERLERLENKF
jgi:uncharacterized protein (UPF0335 family)